MERQRGSAGSFDVVVLGAGLGGVCAAAMFARDGREVALIDPSRFQAPTFKAEKIEPDQAALLRRLGLLQGVLPHARRIHQVHEAHLGRVARVRRLEQYGIPYQDLVNAIRQQIPSSAAQRLGRAVEIAPGPELQSVRLDSGERLLARLVVIAAGADSRLGESIGLQREVWRASQSLSTGFDVAPIGEAPFPFESLTYWPDSLDAGLSFITFFPVPGRTRVNLFSFRSAKEEWVHELAADPAAVIARALPRLSRVCGGWRPISRVSSRPVSLFSVKPPRRDGIVLLGDAFQSVCPSTGTGLSKVLTDVEALCCRAAPRWFATPGMSAAKIDGYYQDPAKKACDRLSWVSADYRRGFGVDRSLRWWMRRRKTYLTMALEGLRPARRR